MSFDMFIKNIKNMPFNNQIFKQLHPFYFLATIFHLFLSLSLSLNLSTVQLLFFIILSIISLSLSLQGSSLSLFLSLSNNCSTQFHFTDLLFCLFNVKQKKKKKQLDFQISHLIKRYRMSLKKFPPSQFRDRETLS